MLVEGIFLPLTTPFYGDGRLYLRKLEANVEHYARTPAAGLIVLGEAGEAAGLTDEETDAVWRSAAAVARPEKVLVAGVERESVFAALRVAEQTKAAGFDLLAVRGPELTPETNLHAELLVFFEAIADHAPLPLLLVSDRLRPLDLLTIGRLAEHENIVGLLDSEADAERVRRVREATAAIVREVSVTPTFAAVTGRMLRAGDPDGGAEQTTGTGGGSTFVSAASLAASSASEGVAVATAVPRAALKTRTRRVGFTVLTGSARDLVPALAAGANGAAPRLGACAPQACCEVYQAFRDGDLPLAEEKAARLEHASRLMEGGRGVAALKYGCDFNGYFGGRARLPLLDLTAVERRAVERELAGIRN